MTRLYTILVMSITVFFFAITSAHAQPVELTFVTDYDELNAALESAEQGTIGSVAIAERFYFGSAKRTKDRIRGLIARTFELGDRSVYLYGQPFDASLASELLDADGPCTASYAQGKMGEVSTCFGALSGVVLTEKKMRTQLRRYDARKREAVH